MNLPDPNEAEVYIRNGIRAAVAKYHHDSAARGWWMMPIMEEVVADHPQVMAYVYATKMMLIVSEIGEAMEGLRKDKMDDHLPHRKMVEVELADACIRIFDLAGKLNLDLGGAILEKGRYNTKRADHTIESREASGGKKF